jgi:glutamine synthetase
MESLSVSRQRLLDDFGMRAIVAAELEWYAWPLGEQGPQPLSHPMEEITAWVRAAAEQEAILLESVEAERGPGQLEFSLSPTPDAEQLAQHLAVLRSRITQVFQHHGYATSFAAKPFAEHYGSALHLHLHLEDTQGERLFWKEEEELSPALAQVIAGLLETAQKYLPVFAPTAESWQRFTPGWHAPVNASWGGNNRTVALRLPDGTGGLSGAEALLLASPHRYRRIEHRIAGADSDPERVLTAILSGVHYGLTHQLVPPTPIHGDASHKQYELTDFSPPLLRHG